MLNWFVRCVLFWLAWVLVFGILTPVVFIVVFSVIAMLGSF